MNIIITFIIIALIIASQHYKNRIIQNYSRINLIIYTTCTYTISQYETVLSNGIVYTNHIDVQYTQIYKSCTVHNPLKVLPCSNLKILPTSVYQQALQNLPLINF